MSDRPTSADFEAVRERIKVLLEDESLSMDERIERIVAMDLSTFGLRIVDARNGLPSDLVVEPVDDPSELRFALSPPVEPRSCAESHLTGFAHLRRKLNHRGRSGFGHGY